MKKNVRGQSLVEIVVSVGVVALLITGVVVATTISLKNSQSATLRSLAVQFAQEGLESTRLLRNAAWEEFQGYAGLWCLDKNNAWTPAVAGSCPANIDGTFTRGVTFVWNPLEERMEITISVSWDDGGVPRDTTIETYMTDWQ